MNEEYIKLLKVKPIKKLDSFQLDMINKKISSMTGVEIEKVTPEFIMVKYYSHLQVKSQILNEFSSLGIVTRLQKKETFFKRMLNKLAKDNKETFGDSRLDCCDLNHD